MAELTQPAVYSEAVSKIDKRLPVSSALLSDEWKEVPVALRERAFFSARVESARFLQDMRSYLDDYLKHNREDSPNGPVLKAQGRAQFVADMQEKLAAVGVGSVGSFGKPGTIADIRAGGRLRLIFDTAVQSAHDYAYFKQGQDPEVLNMFPAQRFIRVHGVEAPRPIHEEHKGTVRRKDDLEFWVSMNEDFGVPWGPWGFNSGMGVEDVSRSDAVAMGLVQPGEKLSPANTNFNKELAASIKGLDPELVLKLKGAFGDRAVFNQGKVRWEGQQFAKEDRPAKAKPETPPPGPEAVQEPAGPAPGAFPEDPMGLKTVKTLGGSTGALLVQDSAGNLYVRKQGNNPDHIREEFAADEAYRSQGVAVPEARLYETPSGPVKLARFIEGKPLASLKGTPEWDRALQALRKDFAMDALLGNWDVGGTGFDNILIDRDGKPWRIDNGGSLRFRAQGQPKGEAWSEFPVELYSMRGKAVAGGKGLGVDQGNVIAVPLFEGEGIFSTARRIEQINAAELLKSLPAEVHETVMARLNNLRDLARKALDMEHDRWKEGYADELTQHMLGLRKIGAFESLAKELKQAAGNVYVVDEQGRSNDHLRSQVGGSKPTPAPGSVPLPEDVFWGDIVAAVKNVNYHLGKGDTAWNMEKVNKAIAHKETLAKLAATSGPVGEMATKYYLLANHVENIVKGAIKSPVPPSDQFLIASKPAAPVKAQKYESIVYAFQAYGKLIGAKAEAVASWTQSQGSDSWRSPGAYRTKFFVYKNADFSDKEVFWKDGRGKTTCSNAWNAAEKEWASQGVNLESSMRAWHAMVQEVLGRVSFRYNDRNARALRICRTEGMEVVNLYGLRKGEYKAFPMGLCESSSIFAPVRVFGTERILRVVPHSRVLSCYLFEPTPGNPYSPAFLGDGENEFAIIAPDIPGLYIGNNDPGFDGGSDSSSWGIPTDHLRKP